MRRKDFKRRSLSLLLSVIMVLSLFGNGDIAAAQVQAQDNTENFEEQQEETQEPEETETEESETEESETKESGTETTDTKTSENELPETSEEVSGEDSQTEKEDEEVSGDSEENADQEEIEETEEIVAAQALNSTESGEADSDETGIRVAIDEDDETKVIVKISGTVSWKDDIEGRLEDTIAEQKDADIEVKAVEFVGADEDAKIEFMSDTDKLSFDYDVLFDKVCLTAGYSYNASSTNAGKSGCFIKLFANGHKFVTTDTVTTTGRVRVFGGGNEESVEDTYVCLEGGAFDLVVGGSYANAIGSDNQGYGETENKVTANACTVYIGPDASAKGVVGGCLGGVNTGDITVTYASTSSGNIFVSGSSSDAIKEYDERSLANSASRVDNPEGTITVTIEEGAVAGNVQGTMYSNVNAANVNVINNGTVDNIYGCVGSNDVYVSSVRLHYAAYGVYPGGDYYKSEIGVLQNYEVNANVNIINNGTVNSTIYGGYYDANIKTVNITNNGTAESIYGGGYEGIYVTDTINVEVGETGTAQCIFGGRKTGSWATYHEQDCDINVTVYGKAGCVFGGGENSAVKGNVTVNIYGEVYNEPNLKEFESGVYGGGRMASGAGNENTYIEGSSKVYIDSKAIVNGNVYGGSLEGTTDRDEVYVYGTVYGDVYGGGHAAAYGATYGPDQYGTAGSTYVEVGGNAVVQNVYGGGRMTDVTGNSEVVIKDEASVENVCGSVDPYSIFYAITGINRSDYSYIWSLCPYKRNEVNVGGNVIVTIKDNARVTDTIYGYDTVENSEYEEYVTGTTTVIFDGCTGNFNCVRNADLVQVTNGSDVTIDDTTEEADARDNAQFYEVSDLTIDDSGKLTLKANASIDGNYSGDGSGTLVLTAGKGLTAAGSVKGQTLLSIRNDETTDPVTVPAEEQVYVISEAGSTKKDGGFTWIEQSDQEEESLILAWRAVEDTESSEWYLAKQVKLTLVYDQTGETPNVVMIMAKGSEVDMTKDTITWYEDSEYKEEITAPFIMNEDKTIYASPKKVTLTLVYDPLWKQLKDKGYVGTPDVTIEMNAGTEVDMSTLVVSGHENDEPVFWTTESGNIGTTVTKPFIMNEDRTLYAGATISGGAGDLVVPGGTTFHLSYNSNGGSYIRARAFTVPTEVDFEDPDYIPTREGYVFTGWYTDFDLAERMNGVVTIAGETTVVAGWEESVTLTLVYDPVWQYIGGDDPDVTIEIAKGTEVDMTTLVIPGHENDGSRDWYAESGDVNSKITGPFIMNEDKTIYAGGATIDGAAGGGDLVGPDGTSFWLSYNSNRGSWISARKFTEPTDVDFEDSNYIPTREGYTFTGWYTDFSLAERLNGTVTVSTDMTVVAGWKRDGFVILTLVYDPLDKTQNVTIEIPEGETVDMTKLVIPGHKNDDPVKWYEEYGNEDSRITEPFTMTDDKTIYAGDSLVFYLTYESNGGTEYSAQKFTEPTGVDFSDPDHIPTRERYEFTGWYKDSELTERLEGTVEISTNTTVYAGWEQKKVILTLVRDQNWKKTRTGIADTEVEMEVGQVVDMTTDSLKWYEEPTLETLITKPFVMNTDKTIYAEGSMPAKKVTLTLVYDPLWQSIKSGTPDVTVEMDEGTEVDMTTFVIPGHENDAPITWLAESGNLNSAITAPFIMTADKTIYAYATVDGTVFTLKYDSNGGSAIGDRTFTVPTEVDFEDADYFPTRTGYKFTGWYQEKELQTRLGTFTVSSNMTVYAGWKVALTETISKTSGGSSKKSSSSSTESTTTTSVITTGSPTGDQNHPVLWFAVLLLSGFGVIAVAVYRKKKRILS